MSDGAVGKRGQGERGVRSMQLLVAFMEAVVAAGRGGRARRPVMWKGRDSQGQRSLRARAHNSFSGSQCSLCHHHHIRSGLVALVPPFPPYLFFTFSLRRLKKTSMCNVIK